MAKDVNYTNCKYIEQQKFIDFCKENSVEISIYDLETFEKEKLVYPIKRLLLPEEYAIFEHQKPLTENDNYNLKLDFSSLMELEDEISRFIDYSFYSKEKHPFDQIENNWQKYLLNPHECEFVSWSDFVVDYIDRYGNEMEVVRAKNYYSYWQIYEFDGINDFRTKYQDIGFNQEDNYYYLTCEKEHLEKWNKRKKENISIHFQLEHFYNCLCDFSQYYERERNRVLKKKIIGETITSDEISFLEGNFKTKANNLLELYNIDLNNCYVFIKHLCKQYFAYDFYEKPKLQSLIKRDIWYCTRLIFYLTEDNLKKISLKIDKDGTIVTHFKPHSREIKSTLEVIFPNEREEIKEKSMIHIDIQIKNYNKQATCKYQLTDHDISNFIDFIEKNDLDHFLIFIIDANKDYFSQDYQSNKNLTFNLRNLGIFIEEIIKSIGLNSIDEIRILYPDNIHGFKTILKPICQKETWWSTYCVLYKSVIDKVSDDNFIQKKWNKYQKQLLRTI